MQYKNLATYRLTHYNGVAENINAGSMEEALQNMTVPEENSAVVSASRLTEPIRTVVPDLPKEISIQANAFLEDNTPSDINTATPSSGSVHAGDEIALKAIPARNYEFVEWKLNGEVISDQASLMYTIPDMDVDLAVFTAIFRLADVSWKTEVTPPEATGAGCLAFPSAGTGKAEAETQFLAVAKTGYVFKHWERNGEELGTNELLETTLDPPAEDETEVIYTAVFETAP